MTGVSNIRYRDDIDGLRAIAVLLVVGFHAGVPYLSGGFIGVDVFFVISGYLITQLITREVEAGTFSLWNFYERRVRRIIPALFAMTGLCVIIAFIARVNPPTFQQLSGAAVATALFSSNFWFWHHTGYFEPAATSMPLLHTWSLAVEEQYYILYPLTLFALLKFMKHLTGRSDSCVICRFVRACIGDGVFRCLNRILSFAVPRLGIASWMSLGIVPDPYSAPSSDSLSCRYARADADCLFGPRAYF